MSGEQRASQVWSFEAIDIAAEWDRWTDSQSLCADSGKHDFLQQSRLRTGSTQCCAESCCSAW